MVQRPKQKIREDWLQYIGGKKCGTYRAARILDCSDDTVRRLIQEGKLFGWKVRTTYKLYEKQVIDYNARLQAEAIRTARAATSQLSLDLF